MCVCVLLLTVNTAVHFLLHNEDDWSGGGIEYSLFLAFLEES